MNEKTVKLVIGSLLHDIGKVIYRQGEDRRTHSQSGYEYLKNEVGNIDGEILNCVRYHHASALKNARLQKDDMAYVVYAADNIAAATDRRKVNDDYGFDLKTPLQSVFNILNGNQDSQYYKPGDMDPSMGIPYPGYEKISFDPYFYDKIKRRLTDNLKNITMTAEYVHSLLAVMEANLTYVPSSTAKAERADISLYDHVKMTAAIASCIKEWLEENNIQDWEGYLFRGGRKLYGQSVFLLCTMDLSGIQDFIYTITSKKALRALRARSFYLEIMMEHLIDLLLDRLELSRTNLIYSGGGHCYLLLPNTVYVKDIFETYIREVNQWFMEHFQISLYIAGAYVACSGDQLKNDPEGSYKTLFEELGRRIAKKKSCRYTADDIRWLNKAKLEDYSRECKVCKKVGKTDEDGVCWLCRRLEKFSQYVLYGGFFTVLKGGNENGLPLPGGFELVADDEMTLKYRMENDSQYVRCYGKNVMYTGKHMASRLWVGDYTTGQSFEELADDSEGIQRIGVLRADVDNLGQTLVSGFENDQDGSRYMTLSRMATLSRQLSVFFKFYINLLLKQGVHSLMHVQGIKTRKATIIYSGGDDIFIVGAWNDIIDFSIDLKNAFKRYTQGTLTLSAGIGIYDSGYPICASAEEVGTLESKSKNMPGKRAVTLLEDGSTHLENGERISDGTYTWEELEKRVIGEKLCTLQEFLESTEERGMSFVYRMLELIRGREDRINFARFVYLLARLEPDPESKTKESYNRFSEKMYQWIQSEKDSRELKTAMTIYAYLNRKGRDENANQ